MKRWIGFVIGIVMAAAAVQAAQPPAGDEQQALRTRIEQRYDVVALSDGVALRPKSRSSDVRLIEISDTIAVNGVAVSARELRERVGADAAAILRLSYLDANARRALFGLGGGPEKEQRPEAEIEKPRAPSAEVPAERRRRSTGERVRIFGDVAVAEDEAVSGEVVAVLGSARIDGEVSQEVVAVLGSVDLGPRAVVRGDVVSVGGQVRRAPGAEVHGNVTEVSLGDTGARINFSPWFGGPIHVFGGFGPVRRLVGSVFRFVLLALLACVALVVARRPVEAYAERVADNPAKTTLVGIAAWLLFAPILCLIVIVLAVSIIGIPLLLLVPFAVLIMLLMAFVGFSGTAYAVGQWTRRRLGMGSVPPFAEASLGLLVILSPLLLGRIVALAGWPLTPIAFLLLATGLGVEFLAWSSGLGAVLTNAFARWRANRTMRAAPPPPPVVPSPD